MAHCRYCHRKVSFKAKACPGCGEPNPGRIAKVAIEKDYLFEESVDALARFAIVVAFYIAWNWSDDLSELQDLAFPLITFFLGLFVKWMVSSGGVLLIGVATLFIINHYKNHGTRTTMEDMLLTAFKYSLNICSLALVIYPLWITISWFFN